jgi:aminoglycoside/choline kinase family phosphotransferase
MGVQRHVKVLGIFSRLYYRDGKSAYLDDLPLVFNYVQRVCRRYDDLRPFYELLLRLRGAG